MSSLKYLNWLCKRSPREAAKDLPDGDVWALAVLAVVMAGKRAPDTGREDIERVCAEFVVGIKEIRGD